MFGAFHVVQKAGLVEDLDSSIAEFQEWISNMDAQMGELRREVGASDRIILSKKQLIEANKAQYTRVSPLLSSWQCTL